jgi:hypothetical protein
MPPMIIILYTGDWYDILYALEVKLCNPKLVKDVSGLFLDLEFLFYPYLPKILFCR